MVHLEETLIKVDFHDPENPRQLMTRLRRMFQRIRLDKMEVNILRGFLNAVEQGVNPEEIKPVANQKEDKPVANQSGDQSAGKQEEIKPAANQDEINQVANQSGD